MTPHWNTREVGRIQHIIGCMRELLPMIGQVLSSSFSVNLLPSLAIFRTQIIKLCSYPISAKWKIFETRAFIVSLSLLLNEQPLFTIVSWYLARAIINIPVPTICIHLLTTNHNSWTISSTYGVPPPTTVAWLELVLLNGRCIYKNQEMA